MAANLSSQGFPKQDFSKEFSEIQELLACPACEGELLLDATRLVCQGCGRQYAVVDGIPVLIANLPQET
jgi:uncharacterized protein